MKDKKEEKKQPQSEAQPAAAQEQKTEIQPAAPSALAKTEAPRRGFEEPSEREDFIIPRMKLLQALSPEVVEDGGRFRPGMVINSLTKEVLTLDDKNGIVFVPILKDTNWIRFNPRKKTEAGFDPAFEPGAIIWRSKDPFDERVKKEGKFGPNGETPLATKFLNFLAYLPGVRMPLVVSFSKTSFRTGKELLSLTQFSEGDMFSWKYRLRAKEEKNDIGSFFVFKVEKIGPNEGDDFKAAETLWENFHARDFKTDEENAEDLDAKDKPSDATPEWAK